MSAVLFFIAAIGAIAGAIGVVMLRNPFYSVLALAFHLVSLAALFLLLRAEFVAAAQVIVYAGAVMVLYVFVVAYIGGGEQLPSGGALRVLGPLFALAIAIELCIAMLGVGAEGRQLAGRAVRPRLRHAAARSASCSCRSTCFRSRSPRCCCWWQRSAPSCSRAVGAASSPMSRSSGRSAVPGRRYTGTTAEAAGVRQILHGEAVAREGERSRPAPIRRAAGEASAGTSRLRDHLLHRRRRSAHAP